MPQDVYTTPGSDTWTAPARVVSPVHIECIGAGGTGFTGASGSGGSGGGGGGWAEALKSVTPSTGYSIQVGDPSSGVANGRSTVFDSVGSTTPSAIGGEHGTIFFGGTGGTGNGDSSFTGGAGANTGTAEGGGGGGGASFTGNGGAASGITHGDGADTPDGDGGDGGDSAEGYAGTFPGGGGGGGYDGYVGGLGGGGLLVITYELYPAVPTGLSAIANGTTQIDLSWDAADDATGYDIQSSPDGSSWSDLDATSDPEYSDITLAPGETRYYRVRGTNSFGESDWSDSDSATTDAIQGDADVSLAVSQIDAAGETSTAGAAAITFAVSAIDAGGTVPPAGTGSVAFGSTNAGSGISAQPITGTGAVTFVVSAISGSVIAPIAAGPGNVTFAVSGLAGSGGMTTSGAASMTFTISVISASAETDPNYDTARRFKHFEEFSTITGILKLG